MTNSKLFADLSLLLVALVWGATFVIVQNAIDLLPPITFNGIRFLIATMILGGWLLLFERKQLALANRKIFLSGFIIGVWLFFGYATQTIGLLYTSSSKAGFITGLSVILVPLLSLLLLKLRPTKNAIIGVLVATVGLYLLTMTDISALNQGDALVFLCAIAFALQIVFTGKYSSQFPTLFLTVIQIGTVAVLSLIYSFLFEDWTLAFQPAIILNSSVIIALLITSVFATALAFFAQTNFQKFTTPTRVALIFATEPVFAAITGFIWAHDRLSASAIMGCVLILAGMIFAELPSASIFYKQKKKQENTLGT
ncbi:DMT family transporter [Robertmurraya andreesenii]|uniref:Drug/metabolite transporter (DMT)-like permease n=1 Tax=Anoxybacillus andreesenii TaxID=1325932 RepID=A0ABT9V2J6_9BACL|nr:DMT family transporter [Robertmurraya andreesenii]MDQ0155146.1 drug/metabolite transporter (DMT)-like permease [Robertmurraya andreesenii]